MATGDGSSSYYASLQKEDGLVLLNEQNGQG